MDRQGLSLKTEWKVESFTEKGKFYTVEKFGEEFICDCPSFEYRHIECKHIKKVKNDIDLEFGGKSGKAETKKPSNKTEYSLIYKKNIIKALIKNTIKQQNMYEKNPESFDKRYYTLKQIERNVYVTVLDILNDDLKCVAKNIINEIKRGHEKK